MALRDRHCAGARFGRSGTRKGSQPATDLLVYDRAEQQARARFDRARDAFGDASMEAATAADEVVRALLLNGRGWSSETRRFSEETVRIKEGLLGPNHADLAPSLINLGDALIAAAEYDRAIPVLHRAVGVVERAGGSRTMALAEALDHLGVGLTGATRNDAAYRALERSLRVKESALIPRPWALHERSKRLDSSHRTPATTRDRAWRSGGRRRFSERPIRSSSVRRHPEPRRTTAVVRGTPAGVEGRIRACVGPRRAEAAARTSHAGAYHAIPGRHAGRSRRSLTITRAQGACAPHRRARVRSRSLRNSGPAQQRRHGGSGARGDGSARQRFERVIEIFVSRLGPGHDCVATARLNLAIVQARLGDLAAARREHGRAITAWEKALGKDHPFVAGALTELADVYREEGRPAEALPLLQRALAIREKSPTRDHPDVARTLADLASTLARMGQATRAQRLADHALAIWDGLDAADAPDHASVLALYAELHANRGDYAAAKEYYERALQIRAKVYGSANPLHAEIQSQLGWRSRLSEMPMRPCVSPLPPNRPAANTCRSCCARCRNARR